jgi:lysyl endopeptidase
VRNALFYLLVLIGCSACRLVDAQVQHPGKPMPFQYAGSETIPLIDLSLSEDAKTLMNAMKPSASRLKSSDFSFTSDVQFNYTGSGVWDTLEDGWKIWRIGLHSAGASALGIIFSDFRLEKGVRIFLFDPLQQFVLGAYTSANNKPYGILAAEPVPGDMIFIEMQVPPFIIDPGDLTVGTVGHVFTGREGKEKDGWFGMAGACNPDIQCYTDSLYTLVKHAVVRIVYAGKERCTGTLLANTRKDSRPYVLTAGHCLKTEYLANTAVFFFDYESPWCGGPDGRNHKSVSGGTLVASADSMLDFALVELSEDIPFYYHPCFAGWDASGEATPGAFCIHHPWGDVKKIAIEDDEPVTGNFGEGYDKNTHWQVEEWEVGTTEKGSSGAPLFNTDGRVIGSLTGGDAYCGNSVNDFFQKISETWDNYPDSTQQLSCWLNPLKNSIETIKGYDPYAAFWLTGDTLMNITKEETFTTADTGLLWGSVSGHNSDLNETMAERFVVDGRKYLLGVDMDITSAYTESGDQTVTLCLWNGTNSNVAPVVEEALPIIDFVSSARSFIEFDSVVAVTDTFFVGFRLTYAIPQDTFALCHVSRTGNALNTAFIARNHDWIPMNDPSVYGISVSMALFPVLFDSLPAKPRYEIPAMDDYLMIYPNPVKAGSGLRVAFKENPADAVTVRIFDLSGRLMVEKHYPDVANPLYVWWDASMKGACIIQVISGQHVENHKLIIY